jgi:diguanylate cyclase (GGDEF)-like protein
MLPGYYIAQTIMLDGTAAGVVVVKVDLSHLDERWMRGRSRDEITVADANGVIFLSSRAEWKYRPMQQLSTQAMEQLQKSHQYDGVLREPLDIAIQARLGPREQLVAIAQTGRDGRNEEEARYLMRTGRIDGSDWTINVLVPTAEVDTRVARIAIISAGSLAFVLLAILYVWQFSHRIKEREKSRHALELAHGALEQKHSELQKLTEELRVASITDPLTGAYNRRFFFEALNKLVSASNRHRFALSIVTIDVDHFKRINDFYGHPAGDAVLRELTSICKESLREADVFARFGGEEFIMALPNSDTEAAQLVAERLRTRVSERTIDIRGQPVRITISCGVSQYRLHESGIDDTLKRADEALYAAKKNGRNQVVVR